MKSKKGLIVFLSVFLVLAGTAFAKKTFIEYLGWYQVPMEDYGFALTPADDTVMTYYDSAPFLTFSVPASAKSEAVFIDHFAEALFVCSDFGTRKVECRNRLDIISSAIPADVEVYTERAVARIAETNLSADYDIGYRRSWKRDPVIIRRDSLDWWFVKYISTGDDVPASDALDILNDILDTGFTVNISTNGFLQGVEDFFLKFCMVTVTRTS